MKANRNFYYPIHFLKIVRLNPLFAQKSPVDGSLTRRLSESLTNSDLLREPDLNNAASIATEF